MACRTDVAGQGVQVISCTRGRRSRRCEEPACRDGGPFRCTYPLAGDKAGQTCNRRCCARHARRVGPEQYHCPPHQRHTDQGAACGSR